MVFSLKSSLIENNSIRLKENAENWEDAIIIAVKPLVESKSVERNYAEAIIESTLKFGPYYIIMPGIAMPHAKPGEHVNKDSFSLVTLRNPVKFPDESNISILLCLAATSGDTHTTVAIPQVISLLQLNNIEEKLLSSRNIEDVLALLEEAELKKGT